jgi:hypothetical protein
VSGEPGRTRTCNPLIKSLYATLGVFLLLAVRNPSAHRSLIAFTAWSSFAHALVMSLQGFKISSQRTGFLIASTVLVIIGLALIALAAGCPPEKRQGRLILGRSFSVVVGPRLHISPRVLRHKVSLRRAGLQKTQTLLLLLPVMVPMSCIHSILLSFGRVGD